MSSVHRSNRKASDADLIRLNSVGLSLATVAKLLGCHHTTVTQRLKALGIEPADTRRAFMEDVLKKMTSQQQDWLADQLGPHLSVKDFVLNVLVKEHLRQSQQKAAP